MMSSSLGSTSSSPAWNHALLRKLLHCCFSSEQTSFKQGLHSHSRSPPPFSAREIVMTVSCTSLLEGLVGVQSLVTLFHATGALTFLVQDDSWSLHWNKLYSLTWSIRLASVLMELFSDICSWRSWNGLNYRGFPSSGPSWPKQFL